MSHKFELAVNIYLAKMLIKIIFLIASYCANIQDQTRLIFSATVFNIALFFVLATIKTDSDELYSDEMLSN